MTKSFRNFLPHNVQTLSLVVFIFKTCSDQILANLVNQGVAAALLSSRRSKNLENENILLCLKIAEINMGVNFGSKRTSLDRKINFFPKLNQFPGDKYPNFMVCSPLQRETF